jgi:exo-beta-1,3-glucanase (GH17 family)
MTSVLALVLILCSEMASLTNPRRPDLSFFRYLAGTPGRPSLVAFSPTHHDPRPGRDHLVPPRRSLSEDLQALRPAFDGLVLYGFDKDFTPVILDEAARQGYRAVLLGIWDPMSKAELVGTARLVKQYHDRLALAVCVGNEGIAFDRYTIRDVRTAIESLRDLLGPNTVVPLCTSEPIDEYIDGNLSAVGDFLCPNIHFVFEHPEKNPADAARWVRRQAMSLAEGARRPVLVKETGLPHGGNDQFTPIAQQLFWSAYLQAGEFARIRDDQRIWVSYAAAFEAFDLHWKAEQSKMAVEEMWGMLTPDRKPYPAFFVWQHRRPPAEIQ